MRKLSIKTAVIAILSFSFALTSCNTTLEVTKRKYRKGYHVSISNSKNQQGRNIKESIKDKEDQHSIYSEVFDSPNELKSEELEQFSLSNKNQVASNDNKTINLKSQLSTASLNKKSTLIKNIKTAKRIKNEIRHLKHNKSFHSAASDDDDIDSDLMFVLLLVLALLLPPACVYMIKGKDSFPFKLNLVLWLIGLLGWGLFSVLTINFVWLAYVLAIVHAILVLLGHA